MEITETQITQIRQELTRQGISSADLADSLLDHICCMIEAGGENAFEEALQQALSSFGEQGLLKIQSETNQLITIKKEATMKKTMYVLGYASACLMSAGLLFKIQHWPGAAVMLTLSVALLNLGFLPLYFYQRYRSSLG